MTANRYLCTIRRSQAGNMVTNSLWFLVKDINTCSDEIICIKFRKVLFEVIFNRLHHLFNSIIGIDNIHIIISHHDTGVTNLQGIFNTNGIFSFKLGFFYFVLKPELHRLQGLLDKTDFVISTYIYLIIILTLCDMLHGVFNLFQVFLNRPSYAEVNQTENSN